MEELKKGGPHCAVPCTCEGPCLCPTDSKSKTVLLPSKKITIQVLPHDDCDCVGICTCDPPPSLLNIKDACDCEDCECDPPSSMALAFNKKVICDCDPCECDSPPISLKASLNNDECRCEPECNCDIECDENESKIKTLRLCSEMHEESFGDFMRKLDLNLKSVKREYLEECMPSRKGVPVSEPMLIELLMKVPDSGMTALYAPGNQCYPHILSKRIGDEEMPILVNLLLELRSILSINLAYNEITDKGLEQIAAVLEECENVENLNLMNNDICGEGLLDFVKCLMNRSPLKSLNLNGNKVGKIGFEALSCYMLSGHAASDLALGECDMDEEGFQCFCSSIYAIDHDLKIPKYMETSSKILPISFDVLKNSKESLDERMRKKGGAVNFNVKLGSLDLYKDADMPPPPEEEAKSKTSKIEKVSYFEGAVPEDAFEEFSNADIYALYKYHGEGEGEGENEVYENKRTKDDNLQDFENESTTTDDNLLNYKNFMSKSHVLTSIISPIDPEVGEILAQSSSLSPTVESFVLRLNKEREKKYEEDFNSLGSGSVTTLSSSQNSPSLQEEEEGEGEQSHVIKISKKSESKKVRDKYKILSPSLYSLNLNEEESKNLELEGSYMPTIDKPEVYETGKTDTVFHGVLINTEESILSPELNIYPVDEQTATQAAKIMLLETFEKASLAYGASDFDSNTTDISQLALQTLIELVQREKLRENVVFTQEKCQSILEEALEIVLKLVEERVPIFCQSSQSSANVFIATLTEKLKGSFFNLLQNPSLIEAFHETATLGCYAISETERLKEGELITESNYKSNDIMNIAHQFIEETLREAGALIGSTDPFSYRKITDEEYVQELKMTDGTEAEHKWARSEEGEIDGGIEIKPIQNLFEDIFQMGQAVAEATALDAEEYQKAEKCVEDGVAIFLDDLYNFATEGISENMHFSGGSALEGVEETQDDENLNTSLRLISRPVRLILNRPLFHKYNVATMAQMLGDMLNENKSIKALGISKWGLGEDGSYILFERLRVNRTLVMLDLSCNGIGSEGAKAIAEYLTRNKNLKHLVLNHNQLKDPGIKEISRTIVSSGLECLNISHNNLTGNGLDALLIQIPLTSIIALYVWGNSFGKNTWNLWKNLLETHIKYTDTLVQVIDDAGCIVKSSQVRDTNYNYQVPSQCPYDLVVPPYLLYPTESILKYEETMWEGGGDGASTLPQSTESSRIQVKN